LKAKRQIFKSFLSVSRANIQVASLPTATLGVLLAAKERAEIIDPSIFLYILLFFTVLTYSCQVNCLNDLEVDEKYKKNLSDAVKFLGISALKKIISIELIITGIIIISLCFIKKDIIFLLAFLGIMSGNIYSAPPLRLKKRGILSPLPVMFGLYFLPIIAGWFIVNGRLSAYIIIFSLGYALIMQGITFINTCEDFEEDKTSGICTLAHVLGIKKILYLGSFFVFVGGFIDAGLISFRANPASIGIIPFSAVFMLSAFFLGTILRIAKNLYFLGKSDNALVLTKKYAAKMPSWFLTTRYPLFFICLLLIFFQ
jgi:4-hydroxybenzoate polyprenyltransferase